MPLNEFNSRGEFGFSGYRGYPGDYGVRGGGPESPNLFGLFKALGKKAVKWVAEGFTELGKDLYAIDSVGATPAATPEASDTIEVVAPVETALGDFGELRVDDFAAALGKIEDPTDLLIYLEEQKQA